MTLSAACLALALAATPPAGDTAAEPDEPGHARFAAETHGTLLNSGVGLPVLGLSFGWAVRGGATFGRWGVFVHVEQSAWVNTEGGPSVSAGTLSFGLGGEGRWAEGLLRSSVTVGAATLLFDTLLDRAGHTGLFVDVRPAGFRWRVGRFAFGLDPFHLVILAPVLGGLPLVRVQYRLSLSVEFST